MNQSASVVYQLISFLMQYPTHQSLDVLPEIEQEIESINDQQVRGNLNQFIQMIKRNSLDEWIDHYVEYFDFGKVTNLYVTYLKLGEQRERGLELLKLKKFYDEAGYSVTDKELTDYLPLMLEFCANVSIEKSVELLQMYVKAIQEIREKLDELNSYYVLLFDALLAHLNNNGITPEKANTAVPNS